ncbi:MAG: hypothetical protein COA45_08445 [Zetaproteobacteria bacterium]|nr:MAG: hypothetical protein COA45_08445 [Zetaproteobacteria bacterium]
MADIFIEVDEALKQERMEKIWQRYGGFFIGLLSVIILGTAANAGYKSWQTSKNSTQTDLLFAVTTKTNYSADDLIALAPNLQAGLRSVTGIHAAGLYLEEGNEEKALQTYENLGADINTDPTIAQLAVYMATSIAKNLSAEDKISKLNTIIANTNNPWRYHAMLDIALVQANSIHDYKTARSHLSNILKSKITPETLKQKAHSLDILYALKEKI